MQQTYRNELEWFAPARPRRGRVLCGRITSDGREVGAVSIEREGVLKPAWAVVVKVEGLEYPGPSFDRYDSALAEAHAILRNGIEPGYHDRWHGDVD